MQHWPWLKNTAPCVPASADSRSASSKTMLGDFPPSSSDTRFRFPFAASAIFWPVVCSPVNVILSTSVCAASGAPAVSPKPVITFTTPGGNPTSVISSARRSAESGVCSAGLRTTVFPAARAGPSL